MSSSTASEAVRIPRLLFIVATLVIIPSAGWVYDHVIAAGYYLFLPWAIIFMLLLEGGLALWLARLATPRRDEPLNLRFLAGFAHLFVGTYLVYTATAGIGIWHYWVGPFLACLFIAKELVTLFACHPNVRPTLALTNTVSQSTIWFSRLVLLGFYVVAYLHYWEAAGRRPLAPLFYILFVLALRAPEYALRNISLRDPGTRKTFLIELLVATALGLIPLLLGR